MMIGSVIFTPAAIPKPSPVVVGGFIFTPHPTPTPTPHE
jgi:hypothetical protein